MPHKEDLRSSWKGLLRCSKSAAESAVRISMYLRNRHLEDTAIATRASWNGIVKYWKKIENDMLTIKKAVERSFTGTNRISADAASAAG